MDPLAENHHENNPYMYANNNPVIFVDPDGKDFTLTGVAAQDFARGLQKELNGMESKGGQVEINAETGGINTGYNDNEPPVTTFSPSDKVVLNSVFKEVNKKGNYKDGDNLFSLYGHGGVGFIVDDRKVSRRELEKGIWENSMKIAGANAFDTLMGELSPAYKDAIENNKVFTLCIYSCNSGTNEDKISSFAARISKKHSKSTIIGFEGFVWYGVKGGISTIVGISSSQTENLNDGNMVKYVNGKIVQRVTSSEFLKSSK